MTETLPVEKPFGGYGTLTKWALALAKQGLKPREIRQRTDCSKSTAYNAIKKADKQKTEGETSSSTVEVSEVTKEVPQILEATAADGQVSGTESTITRKLMAGAMLDPEDLEMVWTAVNDLFPEKHQRPEKSMKLLGKIWYKPTNRILQQYLDENVDLYLAIGVTLLVFGKPLYNVVKDMTSKKEEPKREEKKEEDLNG